MIRHCLEFIANANTYFCDLFLSKRFHSKSVFLFWKYPRIHFARILEGDLWSIHFPFHRQIKKNKNLWYFLHCFTIFCTAFEKLLRRQIILHITETNLYNFNVRFFVRSIVIQWCWCCCIFLKTRKFWNGKVFLLHFWKAFEIFNHNIQCAKI